MFSLNDSMRYLLYNKPTDMRKSYHTLCGLVTNELGCDPCNGDVYIFINKARNRIKLLHTPIQAVSAVHPSSLRRLRYQDHTRPTQKKNLLGRN